MRRVLALNPGQVVPHYNLGVAEFHLGRYAETLTFSRRAAIVDPLHADSIYNEAQARLALGDWSRGFALYENRWAAPSFPMRRPTLPGRRWNGQPVPSATLLVFAEQGFGDTLQFVRYARLAEPLVGRIVLACPPALVRLASTAPGVARVCDQTKPLPSADLNVMLLSMPFMFGTVPGTVPKEIPYLTPSVAAADAAEAVLAGVPALRVGLCWKGNIVFVDDDRRSPGLAVMQSLLGVSGCCFISLVKMPGTDPVEELGIFDPMPKMNDFADTAGLLAQLDLIITSDTAVAHLAGALARPCWLMLSAAADWRWLMTGTTTPWYPSMRLFRQTTLGDWASAVEEVRVALVDWAANGHAASHTRR
ncbi:MAG: hypothetical protein HYR63_10385 [Proteobacteria bacterium]|nr:hypothetical protein [Pseudomonadota bacterium]